MKGPLEGVRVIDISNVIAGPMTGKLLADYGADVIKVEHPKYGDSLRTFGYEKDGIPLWWKVLNRNKRAITLNLKDPKGGEILKRLVRDADVLIENYRPGKLAEWGLSYEVLSAENPGLIQLDISGFGQDGPYREKPGFGTVAEAMSGFSYANGFPDKPPLMPTNPLADCLTGIYGAMAVAFALQWRSTKGNGQGQTIDLSLYESLFSIMDSMVSDYDQLGIVMERTGNMPQNTGGPRNAYLTADGKWVAVSANSRNTLIRTFDLIGISKDLKLGDLSRVVENLPEIDAKIAVWISKRSAQEVQEAFDRVGAVVGPVYSVADILEDPQYQARDSFVEIPDKDLGHIKMQGLVPRFSKTPGEIRYGGQKMGESNEDIFSGLLRFSAEELNELKREGVI